MHRTPPGRVPGAGLLHERGSEPDGVADGPRVGVLALQGDVAEHLRMLDAVGAEGVVVRRPEDLDGLDGLVVPGGESTTIGKLAGLYGLLEPLRARLGNGLPAFGTCAGAILLARGALLADGRPSEQPLLGAMDLVARRNAFGRQVASFEADVHIAGVAGGPLHAAFIRAPWFEALGADVEVLATVPTPLGEQVVVARQGPVLASAFHPELVGDVRLHRLFVASLASG